MILAATGHRPDRILARGKNAYDEVVARALVDFALVCLERERPIAVLSGMAQGWDQAVAQACVECGIPFVAAVPFEGQDAKWPEKARRTYRWLLGQAAAVEVCSPGGYAPHKMHVRNQYMVDEAESVLALWNGNADGGTASAVRYAEQQGKPVVNVWAEWTRFAAWGPMSVWTGRDHKP